MEKTEKKKQLAENQVLYGCAGDSWNAMWTIRSQQKALEQSDQKCGQY